jgi:hypothetical protein
MFDGLRSPQTDKLVESGNISLVCLDSLVYSMNPTANKGMKMFQTRPDGTVLRKFIRLFSLSSTYSTHTLTIDFQIVRTEWLPEIVVNI